MATSHHVEGRSNWSGRSGDCWTKVGELANRHVWLVELVVCQHPNKRWVRVKCDLCRRHKWQHIWVWLSRWSLHCWIISKVLAMPWCLLWSSVKNRKFRDRNLSINNIRWKPGFCCGKMVHLDEAQSICTLYSLGNTPDMEEQRLWSGVHHR